MNANVSPEWEGRNPELTEDVAKGIQALRTDRRALAREFLARAVRCAPDNATAWYWLSRAVSDERQRQDCLERVRQLDEAKRVKGEKAKGEKRATAHNPPPVTRDTKHKVRNTKHASRFTFHAPRLALASMAVLLVVLAYATATFVGWPPARAVSPGASGLERPEASGVIRAQEVMLASEHGGYVDVVTVQEGDAVRAGDVLVQLDTSLIDAQIEAAGAGVDLAKAGLAKARAGARPGQVAVAEAQLAQAEVAYLAATQSVSDTTVLAQNPQDIQLEINVLNAQLKAADRRLAQALALKDAAEAGKNRFEEAQRAIRKAGGPGKKRFRVKVAEGTFEDLAARVPEDLRHLLPDPPADGVYTFRDLEAEVSGGRYVLYRWVAVNINLPFEAHLAPNVWWQAWVGVNATAAERDGLVASLNQLYAQRASPQEIVAQADQALALQARAAAQVSAAQAQLAGLTAGATTEQIAALEAQVAQAEAVLSSLLTQRAQMVIASPIDGIVVSVSTHEGEIAAKGATLITIADLDTVHLTVYLPETQIGAIHLGQDVQVSVDSFAERVFEGTVSHIADSAEFTPRNISTKEERVNLVFAIEVSLVNTDGALKPGMPADAVFGGP